MPFGIINQWHEPPIWHGVERPLTDQLIIPTTWRELGIGAFGSPLGGLLHYEFYLTTTFNPAAFTPGQGLSGGSAEGAFAPANGFAVIGRLEIEPILGWVSGFAAYGSESGNNTHAYDASGKKLNVSQPIYGYEFDSRFRRYGVEARIEWANFFLPKAAALLLLHQKDGTLFFPDAATQGAVPTSIYGGYVELAYNVLRSLQMTRHQLLPFIRYQIVNTQATTVAGYGGHREDNIKEATVGITYRPIQQIAVKTDAQWRFDGNGKQITELDVSLGFMF